jgi:hypothetical protein
MRHLRQILWSFVVLASCTSLLFANVPIAFCGCRSVEQVAPSDASETANCCCSGGCCVPSPATESCCGPTSGRHQDAPSIPILILPHCQQVATQPEMVSVEHRSTYLGELIADASNAKLVETLLPRDWSTPSFAHVFHEPPPSDLVVTLQHFLI